MQELKEKLKKKGWAKKEAERVVRIIKKAAEKKSQHLVAFEKTIYWTAFFTVVFGNFIISVSLIPFLFALKKTSLFIIIITIGAAFGLLAEILMRDIAHLQRAHHILFGILIPLIALTTAFIITTFTNKMLEILKISNQTNPLVVGIAYAAAFIAPYVYYTFLRKN